jgi:hypothetical protein
MPWFQEVTKWADGVERKHHYLLNDSRSKMYAFVPQQGDLKVFRNAIRIDIRGRKFVPIQDQWNVKITAEPPPGDVWTVTGSRGDQYQVNRQGTNWRCTCTGFKYHGRCKHVDQIQNSLAK